MHETLRREHSRKPACQVERLLPNKSAKAGGRQTPRTAEMQASADESPSRA